MSAQAEVQQKPVKRKTAGRGGDGVWHKGATGIAKKNKARTLRATVFPVEGGRPYVTDVEPDEQGLFTLEGGQDYRVMRGSVWEEGGILRTLVNEGNPQTISVYSLVGDDSFSPTALHGVAKNNLWVQMDTVARRKSPWRQASTWGLLALGVVFILVMVWQVSTVGGGLEELREAVDGLAQGAGSGGAGGEAGGGEPAQPSGSNRSGHNDIAPEG